MANLNCGLVAAALIVVLAMFVQSGAALKCWSCNSVESGNCADDFDPSKLTDVERRHFLQDCASIPLAIRKATNTTTRPVCRKLITSAAGQRVFSRTCFYEIEDAPPNLCQNERKLIPGVLSVEFCESCTTDGCNSGSYLGPLVTLLILPAVLAVRRLC